MNHINKYKSSLYFHDNFTLTRNNGTKIDTSKVFCTTTQGIHCLFIIRGDSQLWMG